MTETGTSEPEDDSEPTQPAAVADVDAPSQTMLFALPRPVVDPRARFFMSRAEIAEVMGTHPDTISDYAREGMPVKVRGGHGKESVYDLVACMEWWRQKCQQNGGEGAKEAAQTRAYNAAAELNEMKLKVKRAELVAHEEVNLAGQAFVKALSAKIRSLPALFRQAGLISRQHEVAVAEMCRGILIEISAWKTIDEAAAIHADLDADEEPAEESTPGLALEAPR